ncbi:MAG: hypothetical protein J6U44_06010 [Paludibacteraceae bacterium]|nr:hypothetical protein [Paludibacteraceae bacterium]
MKKLFLVFSIVLLAIAAVAQSKFYVYKTDGSATEFLINDVDSISFVAPTTGIENGYEWVDLGLPSGLRWATCNVGATKPEEYGNYYAWGETSPKTTYSWSTYKWCNGSGDTMTKYCTDSDYGTVDNKTVLDKEDDAAFVNMGGSWRMPTRSEQDELRTECTWTWTTLNDVNGWNVEGPNGNSIFLPAAGYRNNSGLSSVGSDGHYWSSSLGTSYSYSAYDLYFYSGGVHWDYGSRSYGRSVRGVCAATSTPAASKGIGAFSVSADKQVAFSPGNLQYHPANDEWRFAESQTDYIGDANRNVAADYNGWLDLFGFGTGSSPTASFYSPFVDWGTNQIGDDAPNTWRTLTDDEWLYLLSTRTNASSLKGVAQVNGVNGLIFLPDGWSCPDGVTFKSGFHSEWGVDYYSAYQTFTAAEWSKMESAGAVFLPAAGVRDGSDVDNYAGGLYNSSTPYRPVYKWCFYFGFGSAGAYHGDDASDIGRSVRLVKDL